MSIKQFSDKDYFTDSVVLPQASGKGLKVGDFDTGDNASFGWRSQAVPIQIFGGAAGASPEVYTNPTWAQIAGSPFFGYKFAINNLVFVPFILPHDVVPSSALHFGVHWLADNTASPIVYQTNYVTWSVDYMQAKGFNQAAFAPNASTDSPQLAALTVRTLGSATAHQHQTSVIGALSVVTEPNSLVYLRLKRIANATTSPLSTDNTNDIFVLSASVFYQSTGMGTKSKAPDYYAG